jgi:hypothetical protein
MQTVVTHEFEQTPAILAFAGRYIDHKPGRGLSIPSMLRRDEKEWWNAEWKHANNTTWQNNK